MRRDLSLATKEVSNAMRAVPYDVMVEKRAISKVNTIQESLDFAVATLSERF